MPLESLTPVKHQQRKQQSSSCAECDTSKHQQDRLKRMKPALYVVPSCMYSTAAPPSGELAAARDQC